MARTLTVVDSPVANTTASASVTAPATSNPQRLFIIGAVISASAAPTAAVLASIKINGAVVIPIRLPAAAFAPIVLGFTSASLKDGLEVGAAQIALCEVPALGVGVLASAALIYGYK